MMNENNLKEVDWSSVSVDTPMLVRNNLDSPWYKQYFAKYKNGKVYTWADGKTSLTSQENDIVHWTYIKLENSLWYVNRMLYKHSITNTIDVKETTITINKIEVPAVSINSLTLVNCTPHAINYYNSKQEQLFSVPASRLPAIRLQEKDFDPRLNNIAITFSCYNEAENLPPKMEGVYYIVSDMVLDAVNGRNDLLAPDTGTDTVRNERGQVLGITRFVAK